jgi:dienelactone hydrolase
MYRKFLLATSLVLGYVALAHAAPENRVKTQDVTYEYDGMSFKGHLAWDDTLSGRRPGVLVVHEFWGLNDYARHRAEQLAGLGYVAFACDMYGEGKVTQHPEDAARMAAAVRQNTKTWQGRARAALKVLQANDRVDPTKLAAIGYCFGGSTALQLAYSGADLKAVVTFHAALPVPDPDQAKTIKAKVFINHGADDAFIPEETCQKVRAAFEGARVDYQFIYYGGAVHSFTVPGAEKVGNKNMAYNAEADHRSWDAMLRVFDETLGPRPGEARPATGPTGIHQEP